MPFLLVVGPSELKIQSPRHSGTWDLCTCGFSCGTVQVWSFSSMRGRGSWSVRRPHTGPLHQPNSRTVWSICGRTCYGETRVTGKTLCHHRWHNDNAEWQDTGPAVNRPSHCRACVIMPLADRFKSTDAGGLRKKYTTFRHFPYPCISTWLPILLANFYTEWTHKVCFNKIHAILAGKSAHRGMLTCELNRWPHPSTMQRNGLFPPWLRTCLSNHEREHDVRAYTLQPTHRHT